MSFIISPKIPYTPETIGKAQPRRGIFFWDLNCHVLFVPGADPNAVDSDGLSPLAWACLRSRIQTAVLLLDKGADIGKGLYKSTTNVMNLISECACRNLLTYLL